MKFFRQSLLNVLRSHCFPQTTVHGSKSQCCLQAFVYTFPTSPSRTFCTSVNLRKESSQAGDTAAKELDLDIWKSVMRSPQLQVEEEEEADQEDNNDAEHSTLEATRELVEMWRLAGRLVPEHMSDEEVRGLAELLTKSSKKKYLKFLALRERYKRADKEKKERKRAEKAAQLEKRHSSEEEEEEEGGDGRPLRNTFLLKFWSRSLDAVVNWRAAQAMRFGQPLVFDMSYEQNMTRPELVSAVSQLLESEGWNRRSTDPFHLHFCNLEPGSAYHQELLRRYGQGSWDRLLITATGQHYMDLFSRGQLIYLTADSPHVLRTFDHSKVYIVGSMVDRSIQTGLSLAKAKRLQLATARLPLDNFLNWDTGSKNLTLDQMMRILVKLKDGGTWAEALEFVPKRKHEGFHQQQRPAKQSAGGSSKESVSLRREAAPRANRAEDKWRGEAKVVTMLSTSRIRVSDARPKRKKNRWDEE